jgi:acetolactate synthase-1/2/3 large subunit
VLADLQDMLPEDAILVADTEPTSNEVARCYPLPAAGRFITVGRTSAPGSASAAAIGVHIGYPDRVVAALVDEEAMSAQLGAVATAVEHGLPVLFVVLDTSADDVAVHRPTPPAQRLDVTAVARAWGADGYAIRSAAELTAALRHAIGNRRPAVLDVPISSARRDAVGCVAGPGVEPGRPPL